MLNVAIVGGGLCGLALARSLLAAPGLNRPLNWGLFEARDRLGGRVRTATTPEGHAIDLGAAWFWPEHQPNMRRLVADLGLTALPQADDGRVLHLHDPSAAPQLVALQDNLQPAAEAGSAARPGAVHGGAHRVQGGMGAMVAALASPLPNARLHLSHRLVALRDHGTHVALTLSRGPLQHTVLARHVVLALPPRLLAHAVSFEPALPAETAAALADTPTWMATAAKAGYAYTRPFWQDQGLTGNAWVTCAHPMLAEVFDASDASLGALAGFAALPASQRPAFTRGRELLLESQVVQLFGQAAADPDGLKATFWQDWAEEDTTCTPRDLSDEDQGLGGHPPSVHPPLTEGHWSGRLWFGGSETAAQSPGYLEGALGAAARLRRQALAAIAATATTTGASTAGATA